MDNSLEIGDWIVLDTLSGKVIDIQWRYTARCSRVRAKGGGAGTATSEEPLHGAVRLRGLAGWRRWVWFNVDLAVRPAWVIQVVTDDIKSARIANVMVSRAHLRAHGSSAMAMRATGCVTGWTIRARRSDRFRGSPGTCWPPFSARASARP